MLDNAGLVRSNKQGLHVHSKLIKDNLFADLNDFLVNFCPEGRPLKLESAAIQKEKPKSRGSATSAFLPGLKNSTSATWMASGYSG